MMALRKWLTCSVVLLFLTSCILPSAIWASEAHAPNTFTMTVSKSMPNHGDTIEVVINGHQLVDVYAFEVNLEYDPTRLKFIDAKSDMPGFSVPPILRDTHIQLAHTNVGKVKGLEGDQVLFIVHFEAIQNGKSELKLSNVMVVDSLLVNATKQLNAGTTLTIHDPFAFDDLDDYEWAIAAIEALAAKGVVNGTGERVFSPGAAVTRADFTVLLMRALGLKGGEGQPFDDVAGDVYYAGPIAAARSFGIVQGDDENHFHPQASITREDMIVLTDRALRASGHLTTKGNVEELAAFDDVASISDYAVESAATLVQIGLVHGYANGVYPQETTNRAQAAVLMYNLLNYIK